MKLLILLLTFSFLGFSSDGKSLIFDLSVEDPFLDNCQTQLEEIDARTSEYIIQNNLEAILDVEYVGGHYGRGVSDLYSDYTCTVIYSIKKDEEEKHILKYISGEEVEMKSLEDLGTIFSEIGETYNNKLIFPVHLKKKNRGFIFNKKKVYSLRSFELITIQ